jgi:hypothetical protein
LPLFLSCNAVISLWLSLGHTTNMSPPPLPWSRDCGAEVCCCVAWSSVGMGDGVQRCAAMDGESEYGPPTWGEELACQKNHLAQYGSHCLKGYEILGLYSSFQIFRNFETYFSDGFHRNLFSTRYFLIY